MKPFIHKSVIGDFFDVLHAGKKSVRFGENALQSGGMQQREAVAAVLSGDFPADAVPRFAASLDALLTSNVQLAVLDLSGVRIFSANAASVLVNFLAETEGRGKRLVLYRPSLAVRDTLASCNLTSLFEIQETEEELLLDIPDRKL